MVFQWDRVVEEEVVMKGLESASDGESSLHLLTVQWLRRHWVSVLLCRSLIGLLTRYLSPNLGII